MNLAGFADDRLMKDMATIIAAAVRNALEGVHGTILTDEQMKKLNPDVRNAIYTALYACAHCASEEWCRFFLEYHKDMIGDCWEEPQLLEGVTNCRRRRP